jgi:3-methyl-2-oxobutanoate hydroxymethyltransferase
VNRERVSVRQILESKGKRRIGALTAYDFPMARLLDEAGVPVLLVGDSLGMVVLGYPDTTHVSMADMLHHVRAVARARPTALVGADLPYGSYDTPERALTHARDLQAAGADFVKAEGGAEILPQIRAILAAGIPFCGHLGMLPPHVLEEGGSRDATRPADSACCPTRGNWNRRGCSPASSNWSRRRWPGNSPSGAPAW